MKIFGINFTTKKELKKQLADQKETILELCADVEARGAELKYMRMIFPFDIGQTVYDVALRNEKGRYTKTHPSFEYSTITEVVVDEKNYFVLVKRLGRKDVFFSKKEAEEYLKTVCR
jgi:hypothetical protein